MLINGTIIHFADGSIGTVGEVIGEGGQGEVYELIYEGKKAALKWYKERPSQDFLNNLAKNVEQRSSPDSSFLWPKAYTDTKLGSGYVMDLIKPGMVCFNKFLCNKCYFKKWTTIINASINLCVAFQKLHAKGLAYFDLNDGNFFFNPETGELQIGDNDNVSSADNNVSRIKGKRGYVAPEIELGKNPNRHSDYFSLAIILFRIMFLDHPFHGKMLNTPDCECITEKVIKLIYGTNPTFIFDATNKENAADEINSPNALERWNKEEIPEFIKKAFAKVFARDRVYESAECIDVKSRLMECDWIQLLMRWRSALNICPVCGEQTLIEPGVNYRCKKCKNSYPIFWMKLELNKYVPLVPGQQVFESQIGLSDHFKPVAEIVTAGNDRSILGMRNLSQFEWLVTIGPNQQQAIIRPGKAFPLYDNTTIRVSNVRTLSIRLVAATQER